MTPEELRRLAQEQGWSEDFQRFSAPTLQGWLDQYWDPSQNKFRSMRGAEGYFEKPTECPPGMMPSGPDETDPCIPNESAPGWGGGGGAGGGGGRGGRGGYGPAGDVPEFKYTPFVAPTYADIGNDPAYQFRLKTGIDAIQKSAAARGLTRAGGTLQDIMGYGQDLASQEYGNQYNRALQTWGAQYQGEKDAFAPQYGGWQTMYAGDLSRWTTNQNAALQKYLQREQNIYGLMNPVMPGM
jgi:hypothetical protein